MGGFRKCSESRLSTTTEAPWEKVHGATNGVIPGGFREFQCPREAGFPCPQGKGRRRRRGVRPPRPARTCSQTDGGAFPGIAPAIRPDAERLPCLREAPMRNVSGALDESEFKKLFAFFAPLRLCVEDSPAPKNERLRQPPKPRRWWRYGESNPRPSECHSDALPTELYPQKDVRMIPNHRDQVKSILHFGADAAAPAPVLTQRFCGSTRWRHRDP